MRVRRQLVALGVALAVAVALAAAVKATDVTVGGITLTYPSYPVTGPALVSCEPWEEPTAKDITLTGVPADSSVLVTFGWTTPGPGSLFLMPPLTYTADGNPLTIPVTYPPDSSLWPTFDPTTNERAIAIVVFVRVTTPEGIVVKLVGKKWWIRCLPPPPPAQGCTPGYWKQDQHFDSWTATGYSPADDFGVIFGVSPSFSPSTLLDALELGGGGEYALARHAVAALLDASNPDVAYLFSVDDIIAGVQAAYASGDFEPFKDLLDAANNAGCPLN